jgi:hypothetical protein
MQAIGNNPSLDNSASVCRPRTIGGDKDILANVLEDSINLPDPL